jgi:hypothetical protein
MDRFLIFAVLILLFGCTSADSSAPHATTSGTSGQPGQSGGSTSGGVLNAGGNYDDCLLQCNSGAGSGEYCKDGCRFEQAENTKELKYCDQLDQKESIPECYGTVAIAAGDIKICDKLSSQEDRNHCVSAFSPR